MWAFFERLLDSSMFSPHGICLLWEPELIWLHVASDAVIAGRTRLATARRVAFVEDEVDHLKHRGQTGGEFGATGDFEGDSRFGKGSLGPDDSLGDRRLRNEKSACDLVRCQTSKQA